MSIPKLANPVSCTSCAPFFWPDIDECGRHPAVCGEGARCVNLEGDFECRCLLGYRAHNASDPLQPLRDKGSCKGACFCSHFHSTSIRRVCC